MTRELQYGGCSIGQSFSTFYYGCKWNEAYRLPVGAIYDVVYSPAAFAPAGTPERRWRKVRFRVVMTTHRGLPARMIEEVAKRDLTKEEIAHHKKLLDAETLVNTGERLSDDEWLDHAQAMIDAEKKKGGLP